MTITKALSIVNDGIGTAGVQSTSGNAAFDTLGTNMVRGNNGGGSQTSGVVTAISPM